MKRIAISIACVAAAALLALGGETDYAELDAAARLQKLDWMRGEWTRQQAGDDLEEIWSAPGSDSLIGMFRWSKGGKAWMFELMSITVEGDDVVFRLKHFDRKLKGWEEKAEAMAYALKSQGPREVVFEHPTHNNPRRFVYRLDDEGRLAVGLESEQDGQIRKMEFLFTKR